MTTQQSESSTTATVTSSLGTVVTPRDYASRPESFDGNPIHLERFLVQLNLYFALLGPDNKTKILITLSHIKNGSGDEWAAAQFSTYSTQGYPSWDNFVEAIKERFTDLNASRKAQDRLESLQQGTKSADEFFLEYEALARRADFTTSNPQFFGYHRSLLDRNLNAALVDKLYASDLPDDYTTFKKRVTQLDNLWRARQAQRRPNRPITRPQSAGKGGSSGTPRLEYEPEPMDIDRRQLPPRFPRLAPHDRERLLREGKCFYCKEPGHLAVDCPRKQAPITQATSDRRPTPRATHVRSQESSMQEEKLFYDRTLKEHKKRELEFELAKLDKELAEECESGFHNGSN
jgi:hypothetical protein